MKKIRCTECGKTLLLMEYGKVEVKCQRCGHIMKVEKDKDNEQRERPRSS